MYQSIDDNLDGEAAPSPRVVPSVFIGIAALIGMGLIIAAAYFLKPGGPTDPTPPLEADPVARATYLQAIGETEPALRRARLRDYLNQNPEHSRASAAQAQLYVLDAAEARAWQETVNNAYDRALSQAERLAKIENFEQSWGRYLGGRDMEIASLRAEIEAADDADTQQDRSLPDGPSPFPTNVPDGQLAGGPRSTQRPIIVSPPTILPPRAETPIAEIVPPRERRRVSPRYPRSAERRGIGAVVTLSLNIDARGRVAMTEVVSVQADRYAREFARAAERAALRTRFYPQTVNGEPVPAVGIKKTYRFEI